MTQEQIKAATEFLAEYLSVEAKSPREVIKTAWMKGISSQAVYKVKQSLGVKKLKSKWYMINEGESGKSTECLSISKVSCDWIRVIYESEAEEE